MTPELGDGFVHATRPLRVLFGAGIADRAGEELDRIGAGRVLVVATPRGAEAASGVLDDLGERVAGIFTGAEPHVPSEAVAAARKEAADVRADGLFATGGGSAIGLAKAVALETGLPILALPTTYSGSEMTAVWGITHGEGKETGRSERVAPRVVLYDPARTVELPPDVSATSGMNALAHAVEAVYAPDASPLSALLAEEGIRALSRGLSEVVRAPGELPGRTRALYGAHLSGWALDLTSMGLHHKLCHVLGGTFGLPHAEVHAILLPHVTAFNTPAAPSAMDRVARALGATRAAEGIHELNRSLGIVSTLADLGLGYRDLERAAEMALSQKYPNPRPVQREGLLEVLEAAWGGRPPRAGSTDERNPPGDA